MGRAHRPHPVAPLHATIRPGGVFWLVMADDDLTEDLARDLDGTFERLVTAHQDRIYTIALRILADRSDAEEAAQDTFVRAYRALAGYPAQRIRAVALRPWLATIALNACRNRRRRVADRRPALRLDALVEAGFDPRDPGPSVEGVGERRVEIELWARRLAELPQAQRVAIVLHHVDGLSYPEVAEVLGRPVGTVKASVHRGLRRLRARVEDEGAGSRKEMTA